MTHNAPTFPGGADTYHVNLGLCERTISKKERCPRAHRQAHDGQPRLQDKIVWQDNGDTPVEQCSPKSQQACLVQSLYICNPAVEAKFALAHDCSTILSPFSLLSHLSKYLVPCSCAMSLSKRSHFGWKYTLKLNNFNNKKISSSCVLCLVSFLQDFWSLVSLFPWRTKYDSNLLISSSCVLCPPSFCFPRRLALSPRGSDEVAKLLPWRWPFYFQLKRPLSSIVSIYALSPQEQQAKSHEAKSAKKGLKRSPDGHSHSAPSVSSRLPMQWFIKLSK